MPWYLIDRMRADTSSISWKTPFSAMPTTVRCFNVTHTLDFPILSYLALFLLHGSDQARPLLS